MNYQQVTDAETFFFPLLPYAIIALSILVVFGLSFIKSPYGRHAGQTYRWVMSARVWSLSMKLLPRIVLLTLFQIAWFLQETTSFLCIPIYIYYGKDSSKNWTSMVLMGFFVGRMRLTMQYPCSTFIFRCFITYKEL